MCSINYLWYNSKFQKTLSTHEVRLVDVGVLDSIKWTSIKYIFPGIIINLYKYTKHTEFNKKRKGLLMIISIVAGKCVIFLVTGFTKQKMNII